MMSAYLKIRNAIKDIVYFFQSKRLKKKEFPEIINIETSILCNARCITCPHRDIKRAINMDFSIVKKIIDETSNYTIKEIHPFNYGEPFLYSKFIETLRYIRKKIPNCKICIYSNGGAMTEQQMQTVVKEHLLDNTNFSLDAARPETYKIVRGIDYKIVTSKVNRFIQLNREHGNKVKLSVSFVINDKNKDEVSLFKKQWKNKVNYIHLTTDDGREGKPFINRASKNPCSWLFNRITILTNGEVAVCCVDAKGTIKIGNIKKNSIKELWDSEAYKRIRYLHLTGQKNKIPTCAKCYVRY